MPPAPLLRVAHLLGWVAAVGLVGWVAGASAAMHRAAEENRPRGAVDAVAIYEATRAIDRGEDPTDPDVIRAGMAAEVASGMPEAVVSTLYPPTATLFVRPFSGEGWAPFVPLWRGAVLVVYLIGAAAVGGRAGVRHRAFGAAAGAALALLGWPLVGKAVELGTVNLAIAGIFGLSVAAAAADRAGLAAIAGTAGAAIKLVPGVVLLPLAAAGRWRGLLTGALAGLGILAATAAFLPVSQILESVLAAIRFQSGVFPAWATRSPLWTMLGLFRLQPLGLLSFGLAATCAFAMRNAEGRPRVLASAITLCAAWVATSGAAVGVFYGLLLAPAFLHIATWGFERGAPRWAWALLPTALFPLLFQRAPDDSVDASREMFLVCAALWLATAARLCFESRAALRRPHAGALGLVAALALGFFLRTTFFPPEPQGPRSGGRPGQPELLDGQPLPGTLGGGLPGGGGPGVHGPPRPSHHDAGPPPGPAAGGPNPGAMPVHPPDGGPRGPAAPAPEGRVPPDAVTPPGAPPRGPDAPLPPGR